ncbi:MAG: hypothetical protein V3S35_01270 [Nitrosomonadaceae bacterium]
MSEYKFKVGQKVRVLSAITPSLQGRIGEEPKYIQKEGEFEYLICTEKHITLGNLGNMSFFESELAEIEDQTT